MAMPGGPYGEKTCIKTYIREAKMAFRSFQFEKKEMRKIQKKRDITSLWTARPAAPWAGEAKDGLTENAAEDHRHIITTRNVENTR